MKHINQTTYAVKFKSKSTTSVEYMTSKNVARIPTFPAKIRAIAERLNLIGPDISLKPFHRSLKRKIPSMKSAWVYNVTITANILHKDAEETKDKGAGAF